MKTSNTIRWAGLAGLGPWVTLGLIILVLQTGCSNTPRWGSWSEHPSPARIAAVLGRQDSYVYYPAYGIYYNRTKEQYVFPNGPAWITQSEPPREVLEVDLQASPSVMMNFTDAPERHHASVVRSYPRYWGRPDTLTASAH